MLLCMTCCCSGGTLVPYMLDESKNWAMSIDSLKAAVKKARSEGKAVRGLVFINPGVLGDCCSMAQAAVGTTAKEQKRLY